jgi:dethiobiotin synthetase
MNNPPIFISGIGTGVGKTIVSAIVTEALQADYWKPIQAGFEEGTDALLVKKLISNPQTTIHPEIYKLKLAASPHIAAKAENIKIDTEEIVNRMSAISNRPLIIEGAGGIMVPLNNKEFVIDLVFKLQAKLILVSRNYLGSINHSLLTAAICKQKGVAIAGWIFCDQYMNYENEIVEWSEVPKIGSIPFSNTIDQYFVKQQAVLLQSSLQNLYD